MNIKAVSSLFLAVALPTIASAQALFHATPLPALPGTSHCDAWSINGSGDVAGFCGGTNSAIFDGRAVVWHNGVPRSLGTLPNGTYSSAVGINSLGTVIGISDAGFIQPQTFVTTPNGLVNVDPMNGANVDALGITDSGIMFGNINKSGGGRTADWYVAMWTADPKQPGRYREIALPKSNATTKFTYVWGIACNNAGQVVGMVQAINTPQAGGLWNNDSAHSVVALPDFMGSTMSTANGINDLGQVTGSAAVQYLVSHAVIFSADASHTPADLGTLPGDSTSVGLLINNAGQVVGTSTDGVTMRDFFYANGSMQDLASLIDPADGVFALGTPKAINNAGQIVVDSTIGGQPMVLLLTPISQ